MTTEAFEHTQTQRSQMHYQSLNPLALIGDEKVEHAIISWNTIPWDPHVPADVGQSPSSISINLGITGEAICHDSKKGAWQRRDVLQRKGNTIVPDQRGIA